MCPSAARTRPGCFMMRCVLKACRW
jgi:hypothetical protein